MKFIEKFIIVCTICFIVGFMLAKIGDNIYVSTSQDIYAMISNDECLLYSENKKPILLLPKSYYVKIIDKTLDYYLVEYKYLKGYVFSDSVELTSSPEKPYPDDFIFGLKDDSFLYSSPSSDSKIMNLGKSEKFVYLGSITGESIETYGGNVWYYVKLENQDTYGYIYSYYSTGISGMTSSDETASKLVSSYDEIKSMSKSTFVFIVILLCIPMGIITYILFTPKIKVYKKEDFFE